MKKALCFFSILICAAIVIVLFNCFAIPSSAGSEQSRIEVKLENLGVMDAQDQGIVGEPLDICYGYRLFTSTTTGKEYYFEPDSGQLMMIRTIITQSDLNAANNDSEGNENGSGGPQLQTFAERMGMNDLPISNEERIEIATEYVLECMNDCLIGDLEFYGDDGSFYVFYEYYNNQRTGTEASVRLTADGEVAFFSQKVGSLFERNADGTYSLKRGSDFISPELAIDVAQNALQTEMVGVMSAMDNEGITYIRTNDDDSIFYVVTCPFLDTCEDPCTRNFYAYVDAYTGELIKTDFTK